MHENKPISTPLAPHFKLSIQQCPRIDFKIIEMENISYASSIGSLMYAMIGTILDLPHSVSVVSRFMNFLGKQHWEGIKWIFRYPRGSTRLGLAYEKGDLKLLCVACYTFRFKR